MMFWVYFVLAIVLIIFAISFFTFLCKRLALCAKIKILCKKNGCIFHRIHAFAFFGRRNGRYFDFYIERKDDILAIKLFFIPFKLTSVYFCESEEYFLKYIIPLVSYTTHTVHYPIYGKRHMLKYETRQRISLCDDKKTKKILLVSPNSHQMFYIPLNGAKKSIYVGDIVGDYIICSDKLNI